VKVCDVCGGRYKDKGGTQVCPFDGAVLRQLPDPLVGRTISGRYVISAKIGGGGFGIVYRATHEVVGREVAIKFLIPELAVDATNRSRFLREAKAANRIDHEHIIDITDYGETDDGLVYLVMELLEGRSLAQEIAAGPLGVRRAVDITIQCASALARAHELDVVHRDIKPDNVFLVDGTSRRDFAKLLDFGLAQMKGELRLTATGAVFGTPEYMAPEQGRGAPLTGLADLYGIGCVLFEMVSGRLPFTGSTPDLILKHMREAPPMLSRMAEGVPPLLEQTVNKLLEKDPKRRHRDAHHLLEDLRKIEAMLPPSASVPPRPSVAADANVPVTLGADSRTSRRRDVMMSVPPDERPAIPSTVPTAGPMSAAPASRVAAPALAGRVRLATGQMPPAWERRAELFRELVPRAHGAHAPPWLLPAIEALATKVHEVKNLETELARVAGSVNSREGEIRNLRLRLGHAIDEIGRDESRALGVIDDVYRRLAEAKGRHANAEPALAHAMVQLRSHRMPVAATGTDQTFGGATFGATIPSGQFSGGTGVTHELAVALSDAGLHAAAWLEAEAQVRALSAEIGTRERERDDVRFQLSQLKGRLGSLTAEQDLELTALRDHTADLDRRANELREEISQRAGVLTEHFAGFPALRDAMRAVEAVRVPESAPKLARR
jgi:serine/threonine-protein kinase